MNPAVRDMILVCSLPLIIRAYWAVLMTAAWNNVTIIILFLLIATTVFVPTLIALLVQKWLHRQEVDDLGVAVAELRRMQTALSRLDHILFAEQRNRWLMSVEELQGAYGGYGLDYLRRLVDSSKADRMLCKANDLLGQGDKLLHPKIHLHGTMKFYKDKVIGFIKDRSNCSQSQGLMGIWGMGGMGKSSLLKLVLERYDDDDGPFKVMFVCAGITCTVGQVQEAIASSMELSIERSETSQAKTIRDHLKYTSFLLLLDDLWGYLDLKAVGIPSPLGKVWVSPQGRVRHGRHVQRIVLLTTRNKDLCGKMGCGPDNTIRMESFAEEDAWELYRRGWPAVINRVDPVHEVSGEILPEQTSRQLEATQPQRLQDDQSSGMMSSYEKVRHFIEDEGSQQRLLLGVWGMRGVGKTALLRLVRDSYAGNSCFDHVMLVGAGTGCVVTNVQHAIAIDLGLDLSSLEDELSRAKCIFDYLQHKSFLLLLDDIREPLNWWAVGLPTLSHRRQKIILATRSEAACALMQCHAENTIEMQCLGKDDAWNLFRDKVGLGIIDDHPQVHHLAQQMVSQCGGLPLALCALGRAMSNKKDPREWRSVYSRLMAMRLEPCEIDEKAVSSILSPYGWREDNSVTAKQIQAKTNFVSGNKQVTLPLQEAKSSMNKIGPSPTEGRRGLATPILHLHGDTSKKASC